MFRKSIPVVILLSFIFLSCGNASNPTVTFDGVHYELTFPKKKSLSTGTAVWYFSNDLQTALKSSASGLQSRPLSFFADLSVSSTDSCTLALIYDDGLTGPGARITGINSGSDMESESVRISLGICTDSRIPTGFLIQCPDQDLQNAGARKNSEPIISLTAARFEPLSIGWSRYPQVTVGFSAKGGSVKYTDDCPVTFDFSGAAGALEMYPDQNLRPEVRVSFEPQPVIDGRQQIVDLTAGTEKIAVRQSPAQKMLHLYPELFRNECSRISVVSNQHLVSGVWYVADVYDENLPVTADPGLILSWPQRAWRRESYQLYRWEILPQVLIFDFADYGIQDLMLKRLAFFTEKAGYKGRLAPDDEIKNLHGYNAHDYRAESLALFFNAAAKEQFPLNGYELQLRDILIREGIILQNAGSASETLSYSPGTGAIISISQESSGSLRWQLLAHEAFHGLFFSDESLRNQVAEIYDTMDQRTLEFLLLYFKTQSSLGYDTEDRYLMHTELFSYILQQGRAATADYFIYRSNYRSMFTADEALCDYIKATNASGFSDVHERLEQIIFEKYGLKGGRVNLVDR